MKLIKMVEYSNSYEGEYNNYWVILGKHSNWLITVIQIN